MKNLAKTRGPASGGTNKVIGINLSSPGTGHNARARHGDAGSGTTKKNAIGTAILTPGITHPSTRARGTNALGAS